jgi:hypothetical protein
MAYVQEALQPSLPPVPSFIFLRYRLQHLQQDLRCFAGALHF